VDACPVADTLQVKSLINKRAIPKKKIAIAIVGIFMLVTGLGMVTGNWQNDISKQDYLRHIQNLEAYGHPTSTEDVNEFNRKVEEGN
jgi:hypothetical protein